MEASKKHGKKYKKNIVFDPSRASQGPQELQNNKGNNLRRSPDVWRKSYFSFVLIHGSGRQFMVFEPLCIHFGIFCKNINKKKRKIRFQALPRPGKHPRGVKTNPPASPKGPRLDRGKVVLSNCWSKNGGFYFVPFHNWRPLIAFS